MLQSKPSEDYLCRSTAQAKGVLVTVHVLLTCLHEMGVCTLNPTGEGKGGPAFMQNLGQPFFSQ